MNVQWRVEPCMVDLLAKYLVELADSKWLVKHIVYAGTPNVVTVVSLQSAAYAPKEKKTKKL